MGGRALGEVKEADLELEELDVVKEEVGREGMEEQDLEDLAELKEGEGIDKLLTDDESEVKINLSTGLDALKIASNGVAYNVNEVLWCNLGVDVLDFKRYHQEFQKAYTELSSQLQENFGIFSRVGRYGLEIHYFGRWYLFSKDYITGKNIVAGDKSVFASYLYSQVDLESKRVKGRYLTIKEAEEARHVAVEQFIILPTEQDIKLKDMLVSYSLTRPKDWIDGFEEITEDLGLEVPKFYMDKGAIIREDAMNNKKRLEWKYDKNSVMTLIDVMCKEWEKHGDSNRKPDNKVVRGGGITLVNLTPEQRKYREYIENNVKQALKITNKVSDIYRIKFSNTTTSCYVEFTDIGVYDLKVSIRDHEEMHENGYYRFYIDAVGRENFSKRLAVVIEALIDGKRKDGTGSLFN